MNKKIFVLLIVLSSLCSSCCFSKEEHLGNNFILTEYDSEDIQILYSEETCANSGIPIVPRKVLEYGYDSKWIIAKSSSNQSDKFQFLYWIIDKDFKVKIIIDNDSTLNTIKRHVYGPLDSISFAKRLIVDRIAIVLKKT